ncbi:MAG: transglycosylase domain-containing protein [Cryomorphaceae bacterium]|nr:transglycosylase domain-containing protein [Flavobacteriales bacterium]
MSKKAVFLLWLIVLLPFAALAGLLILANNSELPDTAALANPKTNLATEVLSSDGEVLGKFYLENRTNVDFEDLSPYLVQALVATEDERFYSHSGIDLRGTLRAGVYLGKRGGASTITQQLSKMLFTETPGNGIQRVFQKFQEWIIAVRLERQYTKDEILTLYLNKFDWINNAVGIKSAAGVYFGVAPDSLKIEQAAMLIGMAKGPDLYNPVRRPESATDRRNTVLAQMVRNDYITQSEYDSIADLPLGLNFQTVDHKEGLAPYFREVLRAELKVMFSEKDPAGNYKYMKADGSPYNIHRDGLRVFTTIDSRLQRHAEMAVARHLGEELQAQFFNDVAKYRNPPFANSLTTDEINGIKTAAMRRTPRYRYMTGRECPNCHRRVNIEKESEATADFYQCNSEDCMERWRATPADSIVYIFKNEKFPMKVFTWQGERDTLLTPMDSILYYKSILRSGLVSIDPSTGFVKAWVGGNNYKYFKYDHVKQGKRQVGSTFKPFVYATAIREGYSPCYEVPKVPTTFQKGTFNLQEDYTPHDPDRDYGYMVSLKWGLANSVNTVTAWVMKQFGPESVIKLARDLGIESPMEPVVSQCFGVADLSLMEITSANATFANMGVHIKPVYVTRIEDKNGNPIFQMQPETNEALDERTAYTMLSLMQGTVDAVYNKHTGKATGTAMRLRSDLPDRDYDGFDRSIKIAGKTGTTQNQSDGWFMGLTPDLVTGVWVGAEDRSVHFRTLRLGMGTNMALPIWGYYMKAAYADPDLNISQGDFERPEGLGVELDCDAYERSQNIFDTGDDISW